jgi:hypothetical protein
LYIFFVAFALTRVRAKGLLLGGIKQTEDVD